MPNSKSTSSSVSTVKHMPMDLITHILSRLPVNSLSRFNSVSKPWSSLIQSSNFIGLHSNFSKLNPNPIFSSILTVHSNVTSTDGYVFRLDLIASPGKPIYIDFPSMPNRHCRLLGFSNGLICSILGDQYSCDIIVSNPVTGIFRKIPPYEPLSWTRDYSFSGFGSSETKFDFIRIDCKSNSVKVISFSSSTNAWKDVKVKLGKHINFTNRLLYLKPFYRNRVSVFKNGIFYWEGYEGVRVCIVIFDFFNKEFDVISAPYDSYDEELGLVEVKEQIMVVNIDCGELDLWMLNENDKTWTKFKVIDVIYDIPGEGLVTVLGCTGKGKLVLRHRDTNILTNFNVERGYEMYLFAESLAAVQSGEFGDDV